MDRQISRVQGNTIDQTYTGLFCLLSSNGDLGVLGQCWTGRTSHVIRLWEDQDQMRHTHKGDTHVERGVYRTLLPLFLECMLHLKPSVSAERRVQQSRPPSLYCAPRRCSASCHGAGWTWSGGRRASASWKAARQGFVVGRHWKSQRISTVLKGPSRRKRAFVDSA